MDARGKAALVDVAIVGAGPAGAWAATRLAAAGATVALIDGSHPREKPCGGGVTGRALAVLGDRSGRLAEGVAISSASFEHRHRIVRMPLGGADAGMRLSVVARRVFDSYLVDRASAAGAKLLTTRAIDLRRDGTTWHVTTRDGSVKAGWVIGADGPGSLVRRRVSRPFDRADLSIAAGYYVHGRTSQHIDIAFEDHPRGYLWSFPRPDHLAVGTCAQADETTSADLLRITEAWLARNGDGGTRQRYGWPIPSLRTETLEHERPSGERWLLAGDAAGLVDPITREGIFFALTSGDHAAASILEDRDPAAAYATRLRDTIYAELIAAARLKARFYRPQFMALLISALQRSARIRGIMADLVAGEQPYGTLRRRLVGTFEWRLMFELFGLRRG